MYFEAIPEKVRTQILVWIPSTTIQGNRQYIRCLSVVGPLDEAPLPSLPRLQGRLGGGECAEQHAGGFSRVLRRLRFPSPRVKKARGKNVLRFPEQRL